jgi:hypothetical protein
MGTKAGASAQLCSQAGAWEQEAKDLHPSGKHLAEQLEELNMSAAELSRKLKVPA